MFDRSRKKRKEWRTNSDENDRIRSFDGRCCIDDGRVGSGHQEGAGEVAKASTCEAGICEADTCEAVAREAGRIEASAACEAVAR